MRALVIGCGECGGRLAEEFAKPPYKRGMLGRGKAIQPVFPIILNTTRLDMWKIAPRNISEARWINVDEARVVRGLEKGEEILGGCGARRERGREIFTKNEAQIIEEIFAVLPDARSRPPNLVLVTTSFGGGTGSSFSPLLVSSLRRAFWERSGVTPPLFVLGALPLTPPREKSIFTENAAQCLYELFSMKKEQRACGVSTIDNEWWARNGDIQRQYRAMNSFIVRQFRPLIEPLGQGEISGQSLDAEDLRSAVEFPDGTPGVFSVGSCRLVSGESITRSLTQARIRAQKMISVSEEERWVSGMMLLRLSRPLSGSESQLVQEGQAGLQENSLSGNFATFMQPHPRSENDATVVLMYAAPDVDRLRHMPSLRKDIRRGPKEDGTDRVREWLRKLGD
jgi:cell division GTPase FtsZ